MHDLDQQPHVEVDIHEIQQYQEDLTTPATNKLSYLTAPTLERHQQQPQTQQLAQPQQPQTQQPVHQLERRAVAVLLLVPPTVRRLRHPWMARRIAPMVVILHAGPDQQLQQGCGHHHYRISVKPHHGLLTHRRVHLLPRTGPASTSPHHYELSAADDTTYA